MYWYKLKSRQLLTCFILWAIAMQACKPDIKETGAPLKYFDLKGYFYADSARLARLNKPVLKTVIHNGFAETKRVRIANWGSELGFFIGSDINKPAWRDSYSVEESKNALIYTAKNTALRTTRIVISRVNNQVKWILIFNYTKNLLYETKEKLSYFPDSMYMIEHLQKVRFFKGNRYDIKGYFN